MEFIGKLPKLFFELFEKDEKGAYYYLDLVEKHFDIVPENSHNLQGTQLTALVK
jgi:hypothetical protein